MTSTNLAIGVGANIRAALGRQRVSIAELSRRTRIARATLANQIDNGALTVHNFLLIASALDVPAGDLLADEVAA